MIDSGIPLKEFFHKLDMIEQAAWSDFYRSASTGTVVESGVVVSNEREPFCAMASKIDILAFNRMIGFGAGDTPKQKSITELIRNYQEHGVRRFFVQLSPLASETEVGQLLESHGFRYHNNWVKLFRRIDPIPVAETVLEIREISTENGLRFGEIVARAFDWPASVVSLVADTVGRQGWSHYMAFDGDLPVATGGMFISGVYVWIDFASTLPEYRGKGAQSALLARRIEDAAKLGCKWLVVETAEELPDKPAPSYRNMIRSGFETAYLRKNYLWSAE
jgi:GNAT superfamily N-acetyltransferase